MLIPMMSPQVLQEWLFLLVKEYGNDEAFYMEADFSLFKLRMRQLQKWYEDQKNMATKK